MMEFTYDWYRQLLKRINGMGYRIANYKNWQQSDRCVILRHDIDYDIDQAVRLAEIEKNEGVPGTYFVLLTSDFYNVFSRKSCDGLKRIMADGHSIGLHFDEIRYTEAKGDMQAVQERIVEEAELLGRAVGSRIDVVSMHRPSKLLLEADLKIPGMVNSYGQTFFKEFRYLSDSRRRWREPVEEMIESGGHERLHILTHPFWYHETEKDIHSTLSGFINSGNHFRYRVMKSNITDLDSVMLENEVV